MAKRPPQMPHDERHLPPEQAVELLRDQLEKGQRLLQERPLTDVRKQAWETALMSVLSRVFGDNSRSLATVRDVGRNEFNFGGGNEQTWERARARHTEERLAIVQSLIDMLLKEIAVASPQDETPDKPRRERFHVGMACLNGHPINSSSDVYPTKNAKHCPECGKATITACTHCHAALRGYRDVPGVVDLLSWKPPSFCHECGQPFPWTEQGAKSLSEAIGEIDTLSAEELAKLRESIPDILTETPSTSLAASRFKKAFAKIGAAGTKLLSEIIVKVGAEAAIRSMGLHP